MGELGRVWLSAVHAMVDLGPNTTSSLVSQWRLRRNAKPVAVEHLLGETGPPQIERESTVRTEPLFHTQATTGV